MPSESNKEMYWSCVRLLNQSNWRLRMQNLFQRRKKGSYDYERCVIIIIIIIIVIIIIIAIIIVTISPTLCLNV